MNWLVCVIVVIVAVNAVTCRRNYHQYQEHYKRYDTVEDPEFSRLVTKLWSLDQNRASNLDYSLSYQGRIGIRNNGRDASSRPLFSYVNRDILEKPTYKAFVRLLDNYEKTSGIKEEVSREEETEIYQFLSEVLKSPVMKYVYNYLQKKGKASRDLSNFAAKLYELWFRPFMRSRTTDSSGFEHVFVGEINPAKRIVSGFHNWIQFYLQEKSRDVDYIGFIKKGKKNHLLTMQFKWDNELKVIGSAFIGTSPEFEMALYTAVYLMGYTQVQFPLNGNNVKITCHEVSRNGIKSIASCYPTF